MDRLEKLSWAIAFLAMAAVVAFVGMGPPLGSPGKAAASFDGRGAPYAGTGPRALEVRAAADRSSTR